MIYFQYVVPDIPENAEIYEEIHEYEGLNPSKQERYQNHEAVNKIYVSLKPVVMQEIRNQMQSTVSVHCTIGAILIPKILAFNAFLKRQLWK